VAVALSANEKGKEKKETFVVSTKTGNNFACLSVDNEKFNEVVDTLDVLQVTSMDKFPMLTTNLGVKGNATSLTGWAKIASKSATMTSTIPPPPTVQEPVPVQVHVQDPVPELEDKSDDEDDNTSTYVPPSASTSWADY
jgi:hypothetical protein